MINADRVAALFILIFGLAYLWAAISMPSVTIGDPLGHKTFPIFLGILISILGLSLLFRPTSPGESSPLKKSFLIVLLLAAFLAAYGYSLPSLGYPLGTFLFLLITSRLIGERSWRSGLVLSTALSLGIFILFTKLLEIPLPLGVLKSLMP